MSISNNSEVNYTTTTVSCDTDYAQSLSHFVYKVPQTPEKVDCTQLYYTDGYQGIKFTVHDWITLHEDNLQASVTRAAQSVQFISHEDFSDSLKESYASVKSRLDSLYPSGFNPKEQAITLVEGGKSNKWVAELAQSHCDAEAYSYIRLGEKDAREFCKFLESIPAKELALVKEQFKDKTLMLFDDGSYSGAQMSEHIQALLGACGKFSLQIKAIAVVIPYMTDHARHLLGTITHPTIPIILSTSKKINTLNDIEDPLIKRHLADMWYKGDTNQLQKIGLIWLEHKIPNDQSFPGPMIHGSVYNHQGKAQPKSVQILPDITPPYKATVPLTNPNNLHKVTKNLFRGGQPALLEYQTMKKDHGISTIINLREGQEPEAQALQTLGFKLVHIPFNASQPTDDIVLTFLETLAKNNREKFFVHCFHGSDQTGMLIAIAQIIFQDKSKEAVIKEMLDPSYGFHKITHAHLIKYIQDLDAPAIKAALKTRLGQSSSNS